MDKEDENPKENHPPKDIKQNEEKPKDEKQNNQKQKDEKEKENYKKSRKQKHYQKYYQNIAKERHKPQQHTWGSVPKVEKC